MKHIPKPTLRMFSKLMRDNPNLHKQMSISAKKRGLILTKQGNIYLPINTEIIDYEG